MEITDSTESCVAPYTPYPTHDFWTTGTTVTWGSSPRCPYCDGIGHSKKPEICPRVKSISYYKGGDISKIEFHKMEE